MRKKILEKNSADEQNSTVQTEKTKLIARKRKTTAYNAIDVALY